MNNNIIKIIFFNKSRHGRPHGFTMAELVVSIFIIALISGLVLTNYGGAKHNSELRITAQKLASDIRMMQNYSLSEKKNDLTDALPSGGWGIYFKTASTGSYMIFADNDNQHDYDSPSESYEVITLPKYIEISQIAVDGTGAASGTATFLPPDPTVYINNSTSTTLAITLRETSNNKTSVISLNPFGLIDVSN
jgi:prepilin-type N-terminal cleavage/methylation domain-containing protein